MKTWEDFTGLVAVTIFACLALASLAGGGMLAFQWWEARGVVATIEEITTQIDRYRVELAGPEGVFLLDSATGQTWRICRRQFVGDPPAWCIMPPPEPRAARPPQP